MPEPRGVTPATPQTPAKLGGCLPVYPETVQMAPRSEAEIPALGAKAENAIIPDHLLKTHCQERTRGITR